MEIVACHARTHDIQYMRDGFATIGVTMVEIDKTQHSTAQRLRRPKMRLGTLGA